MSHGMEVLNSVGETVFNTNELFCEIASASFTVVGTDYNVTPSGSGLVDIPARCFVDDVNFFPDSGVLVNNFNLKNVSSGTYTSVYQLAVKANILSFSFGGSTSYFTTPPTVGTQVRSGSTIIGIVTANSQMFHPVGPSGSSGEYTQADYENSYVLSTIGTTNVTSYRGSEQQISVHSKTAYLGSPHIYARPVSSSYVGNFGLLVTDDKMSIIDYTGGNNTFEIIVTNTAEEFGGMNGTAKYLAGSSSYGLECLTAPDQQYTTFHPQASQTTFNSGSPIVQVILTKGLKPNTGGTNQDFSLGSLTTSTTKRWCRMDGCQYYKNSVNDQTYPRDIWKMQYRWLSNNSISVQWRLSSQDADGTNIFDNYHSKQPFAVAQFGDGV